MICVRYRVENFNCHEGGENEQIKQKDQEDDDKIFCSSKTQAPFNLPVFEAVVSTTMVCILSNNPQSCKLSYTADDISNPVPPVSPGTPRSCSKLGAMATIGKRSTFALPIISEANVITFKISH
ncbi:uncharacterized protein LOC112680292 isoform X2 [Sipha flava]|uniref:Uncharacterized protein LOC112680292 isoform X2 n=1 Tax=Sipha flava TaxID=143950 RepID=A0A8B8F5X3_9HEMI|nr:uncharacterized protein LOC112680292 isoform X2 [Sipha flava]